MRPAVQECPSCRLCPVPVLLQGRRSVLLSTSPSKIPAGKLSTRLPSAHATLVSKVIYINKRHF